MNYEIIKSKRRTYSISVGLDGIKVRVPQNAKNKDIEAFISKHNGWIKKKISEIQEKRELLEKKGITPLAEDEIKGLRSQAKKVIPAKLQIYAEMMNVDYGKVSIRCQKTRWGSCSAKGNLNFNCLLMLMPEDVIDGVIVHELAHRKHMNHSAAFYEEIKKIMPDYDKRNRWLKENGALIMARLPK